MIHTLALALYQLAAIAIAIYSFQSLLLVILFLKNRSQIRAPSPVPKPAVWPSVTVQLPIFNERFVVERLIDSVCELDYPGSKLHIQVLDDSTDETTSLARNRVERHRARGVNIELIHREKRPGYKAGALAAGFDRVASELCAVIDADFVPDPGFLRALVPHLVADPNLGVVQSSWTHFNIETNLVTRGLSVFLDTHFVVIQPARASAGLLFNFNGSGGIWRRTCIEAVGGWQADTLAEDLDLSYRAQIGGWRLKFLAGEMIPGELPPQLAAIKRQQSRWARGGIQVLLKLWSDLWRAPLSLTQRVLATLHLSSYLTGPILLFFLLVCIPLAMLDGGRLPFVPWLIPVGIGPPLLLFVSQWARYPDWKKRLQNIPIAILLSVGLALNNSLAVAAAFGGAPGVFLRTPKFGLHNGRERWKHRGYLAKMDRTLWVEAALAVYCSFLLALALQRMPGIVPVLALSAASFIFVTVVGFAEAARPPT